MGQRKYFMRKLSFAQKEILVALHAAGREDIVRVSPVGMPPPGEALDDYLRARAGGNER